MAVVNQKKALNKAIAAIKQGKVVVCPTDTVYGFLTDASNKKAVDKIYKIKKRPKSKPLAVFVKDFKMADQLAEIGIEQTKILRKKWPGKFTFVLRRKNSLKLFDGGKETIALRVPKYRFLNDLLKKINKPLAQTSVNASGQLSLSKISDIIEQFGKDDILIIDAGNLRKSQPSKILDITNSEIKTLRK